MPRITTVVRVSAAAAVFLTAGVTATVALAGAGRSPAPKATVAAADTPSQSVHALALSTPRAKPTKSRSAPARAARPPGKPRTALPAPTVPIRSISAVPAPPPATQTVAPPPPPSLSGSDQIAQSVLNALNSSRSQAGLPALRWSSALQRSAHQHNLAMAAANQLSHQLPGEATLGARESQQGVSWTFAAENIGWTSDISTNGALAMEASMLGEQPPNDGHRQNILSSQANSIGIDVVLDRAHGRLWLTEDFARV